MGRQKLQKHIHKYHQVKNNVTGEKTWACGQADCYHFMPAHYVHMLQGKATICWECGEPTVLDERNMKLDKPTCFNCTDEGKAIKQHLIETGVI